MPRAAKKRQDERTRLIYAELKKSFPNLPELAETIYLYNPVSIRLRVIDERFEGKETAEREVMVKKALKAVPRDITEDITLLLMLTPEEAENPQLLSLEFDDPTGSRL